MAFTLRATEPSFADALRWHLSAFRREAPEQHAFPVDLFVAEEDLAHAPPTYSFVFATSFGARSGSLEEQVATSLWAINRGIAERVRDYLLLHSGVVRIGDRAVLLPAEMDSGKSSLVLSLLQLGAGYLSDEFGAIDPIGRGVHPVPKHVSIGWQSMKWFPGLDTRLDDRQGLTAQLPHRFVRPEDVGSYVAGPSPIGALIFPTRDFEGPPRLAPVTSAAAVEAMAASSFNLFRYADRGVILLAGVAKEAPAFRLSGGTPHERAALVLESLS